jgi:N-succinyldiaminopimelate aminotransferase
MAGNRVGYITGPEDLVTQARKLSTHTFYSAPTPGQIAAVRALRDGAAWVDRARELYREAGRSAAHELGLRAPDGSTFLFVDASPFLDDRGLDGFLSDCLDDGVVLSPGGSSGHAYANWVRLCYTAAPPDEVATAISLLAKRLGRGATA